MKYLLISLAICLFGLQSLYAQVDKKDLQDFLLDQDIIPNALVEFDFNVVDKPELNGQFELLHIKFKPYSGFNDMLVVSFDQKLYQSDSDFNSLIKDKGVTLTEKGALEYAEYFIHANHLQTISIQSKSVSTKTINNRVYQIEINTWEPVNGICRRWSFKYNLDFLEEILIKVTNKYSGKYHPNEELDILSIGQSYKIAPQMGPHTTNVLKAAEATQDVSILNYEGTEIDFEHIFNPFQNRLLTDHSFDFVTVYKIDHGIETIPTVEDRTVRITCTGFTPDADIRMNIEIGIRDENILVIHNEVHHTDLAGMFSLSIPVDLSGDYEISVEDLANPDNAIVVRNFYAYSIILDDLPGEDDYDYSIKFRDDLYDFDSFNANQSARLIEQSLKEAYTEIVNNWSFPSPKDIELNYEEFFDVFCIDYVGAVSERQYNAQGVLSFKCIKVGSELDMRNYTDPLPLMRGLISHELFHSTQYHYPRIFQNSGVGHGYLIEGTARFIETVISEQFNAGNENSEFYTGSIYHTAANYYLRPHFSATRNLAKSSYEFALFWRFLYENNSIGTVQEKLNLIHEILSQSNIVSSFDSYDHAEKSINNALQDANGDYNTFDEAFTEFTYRVLHTEPKFNQWSPNPVINGQDFYEPIYEREFETGISDEVVFESNELELRATQYFSNGLFPFDYDWWPIEVHPSLNRIAIEFDGNLQNDPNPSDYVVRVLMCENNEILYAEEIDMQNARGELEFEVNNPINSVYILFARLNAEITEDVDYSITLKNVGEELYNHDYEVTSINLDNENPLVGQTITITGTVKNVGLESEPENQTVHLLDNGQIVKTFSYFDDLDPQQEAPVTFTWEATEGLHVLGLRCELLNDENPNNDEEYADAITVNTEGNLIIDGTPSPSKHVSLNPGGTTDYVLKLQNSGSATISGLVSVQSGVNWISFPNTNIFIIEAGEFIDFPIRIYANTSTPGTYTSILSFNYNPDNKDMDMAVTIRVIDDTNEPYSEDVDRSTSISINGSINSSQYWYNSNPLNGYDWFQMDNDPNTPEDYEVEDIHSLSETNFNRLSSAEWLIHARMDEGDASLKFGIQETNNYGEVYSTNQYTADASEWITFPENTMRVTFDHFSTNTADVEWFINFSRINLRYSVSGWGHDWSIDQREIDKWLDGWNYCRLYFRVNSVSDAGELLLYNNGELIDTEDVSSSDNGDELYFSISSSEIDSDNYFKIIGSEEDNTIVNIGQIRLEADYYQGDPNLDCRKSLSSTTVNLGENVNVNLEFENIGENNADEPYFDDRPLPVGLEYVSGKIYGDPSDIDPEETENETYTIRATKVGSYIFGNTIVRYYHPDGEEFETSFNSVSLVVNGGDLNIVAQVDTSSYYPYEQVKITAEISDNLGSIVNDAVVKCDIFNNSNGTHYQNIYLFFNDQTQYYETLFNETEVQGEYSVTITASKSYYNTNILSDALTFSIHEPFINIEPDFVNLDSTEGSLNIFINSNIGWTFEESEDWLNCETSDPNTIQVTFNSNNTGEVRYGVIQIEGQGITKLVTIKQFETTQSGGIIDYDGNYYNTVTIGSQVWLGANLKATHFLDGNSIPLVTDENEWTSITTPAYCWHYNDELTHKNPYGALYNWQTVQTDNLCPAGWHVPTNDDWIILRDYLGGATEAGGKLKETGTEHWTSPNASATNETGFAALPGGTRYEDAAFSGVGNFGAWWSSTVESSISAYRWAISYSDGFLDNSNFDKNLGASIRCIQDDMGFYNDSLALVELYHATNGDNWDNNENWLTGPVDTWHGITLTNSRVTTIRLSWNNLHGQLPESIGNMNKLTSFLVFCNNIEGRIPSTIEKLEDLSTLSIFSCELEGPIPEELYSLTNLISISLNNNDLTGTISNSIGNLTQLQDLNLQYNLLSGDIPTELYSLQNLRTLRIGSNDFTNIDLGLIGQMTNINYLDLNGLSLTGNFPSELLNIPNLRGLVLYGNDFYGSIPDELYRQEELQTLDLSNNSLSGTISPEIGNMINLYNLRLVENEFSGEFPSSINQCSMLVYLVLIANKFTNFPEITDLSELRDLSLSRNALTFEDIEPNIGVPSQSFSYYNQAPIGEEQFITLNQGVNYTLSIICGGENNSYQWYYNGAQISGANQTEYLISSAQLTDAGDYHCQVTNTLATALTIYSNPIHVSVIEQPTLNKPLISGWNWFSVNLLADDMSLGNILTCTTNDDYIKNQTESATYFDGFGWYGSIVDLGGMDPLSLYKIKTINPCGVSYMGIPVDVPNTPMNIVPGWNWIGYLPQCSIPIAEALSSLSLVTDDYIKNQTESSTYYDGYGWFGSLEELVPGQGYMLNKGSADLLTYPECPPASVGAQNASSARKTVSSSSLDPHKFEFNGSITAQVYKEGSLVGSVNDRVLAYVNGQLRGEVQGIYFEPSGSYAFPLMVFSNVEQGEEVTFRYYHSENDQLYSCFETLIFSKDMIVADAMEAFELHVNAALGIDESGLALGLSLEVYPNPFKNILHIEYSVGERSKVRIEVYDILGKVVEILEEGTLSPGSYTREWNSTPYPEGTYLLKLTTESSSIIKRIILIK